MQPMNDDDFKTLLSKWQAPSMPLSVEKKILGGTSSPAKGFLRWLMEGSIRVPAPLALVMFMVCILLGLYAYRNGRTKQTSLAEFEPVKEFNPRIIRSVYESK